MKLCDLAKDQKLITTSGGGEERILSEVHTRVKKRDKRASRQKKEVH